MGGLQAIGGASCLVTGGASGIGLAIARRLAVDGARVVIADIDEAAASAAAREIDGTAIAVDVRAPEDAERMVALAEKHYGRLVGVFLNAGVTGEFGSWDDFDLDRYRFVNGVNVDGVVFGVRAALPALRRAGGGSIVVTASLAGLTGTPADPVYSLTKHAVVGFVRSLAQPLAQDNITINAVCPGYTATGLLERVAGTFDVADTPLLLPEEVAAAAVAAALGEASGECIVCQPGRAPTPYSFRGVPGPR